jgi:hypothetical protein
MDVGTLKEQLAGYGQEHLLQFWDSLEENEQKELYKDVKE